MDKIVAFWDYFLPALAEFLLSDPIIYFVGLAVLGWLTVLLFRLTKYH